MHNRELLRRYADHTPVYSDEVKREAETALRKALGFMSAEPTPKPQPENKDKPNAGN